MDWQAAALERMSSREAARSTSGELSQGSSVAGGSPGHPSSDGIGGSGEGGGGSGSGGQLSTLGSAGSRVDGRSGSADGGAAAGGGGGLRSGEAAASSGGGPPAPAHSSRRLSGFATRVETSFEPAAAAGPAVIGGAGAHATVAPLAGSSRRSLSAPLAADADSPATTLQPRLSGDLRLRYGLPGDSPPGPPPGAAGRPAQPAAGAGPNERQSE